MRFTTQFAQVVCHWPGGHLCGCGPALPHLSPVSAERVGAGALVSAGRGEALVGVRLAAGSGESWKTDETDTDQRAPLHPGSGGINDNKGPAVAVLMEPPAPLAHSIFPLARSPSEGAGV